MKVKLISYTPDGEKLISSAAKLCYSPVGVDEIEEELDQQEIDKFLNMLVNMGHMSPVEHVNFTFAVEGVSRSLTHQLVRHRIASFSQQSQRYVKLDQFEYIIPPAIARNLEAKEIYIRAMEEDQKHYDDLVKILVEENLKSMGKNQAEKKAIEDARYVFPNACETKIVFTMNARSLMNFFRLRTCNRAQWEIRNLAIEMLRQVKEVYPILFKNAGPGCIKGPCPEGKMTCGKINQVREKFKEL